MVLANHNSGPAVAPRVLKAINADGSVTIRDEGANLSSLDVATVRAELSNDTLYASVSYAGTVLNEFSLEVLTFTVGEGFAGAKYFTFEN